MASWFTAPKGNFQVSVTTTAASLATLIGAAVPADATFVYIQPENGDIRFRDDGTNPTTAIGMKIASGVLWPYEGSLDALNLIATAGSVTTNLAFYG